MRDPVTLTNRALMVPDSLLKDAIIDPVTFRNRALIVAERAAIPEAADPERESTYAFVAASWGDDGSVRLTIRWLFMSRSVAPFPRNLIVFVATEPRTTSLSKYAVPPTVLKITSPSTV